MALLCILMGLLFIFPGWIPVNELGEIFDMTRGRAVGTWLSTTISFLAGCTLLVTCLVARSDDRPKREILGWLILSLFFFYMSVDDCAYIHERSGDFVHRMASSGAIPFGLSHAVERFPTYYRHLIMGPFFGAMGLFMSCFVWARLRNTGLLSHVVLSLSGLASALVLDLAEWANRVVAKLQASTGLSKEGVVHTLRLTEESIEVFSLLLLLYVFLRYSGILLENRIIVVVR